jgi:hypothetical protein
MSYAKARAIQEIDAGICPEDSVSTELQDCEVIACQTWARKLGQQRQSVLQFVRSFHPIGRVMAEGFDHSRSKDQSTKLTDLLAERQCRHVIESSTKSNAAVDMGSFMAGILGVAGLLGSISI